jgi:hypothetical protein
MFILIPAVHVSNLTQFSHEGPIIMAEGGTKIMRRRRGEEK